jgi:hypothetical protein
MEHLEGNADSDALNKVLNFNCEDSRNAWLFYSHMSFQLSFVKDRRNSDSSKDAIIIVFLTS